MKQGRLGYNDQTSRFGVLCMDLWEDEGLHCGDHLEVCVDGKWIATRIEMNRIGEWYLVDTELAGGDLEGIEVRMAN